MAVVCVFVSSCFFLPLCYYSPRNEKIVVLTELFCGGAAEHPGRDLASGPRAHGNFVTKKSGQRRRARHRELGNEGVPVEIYLGRGRAEGRGLLSSISLLSAFLLTGIKRDSPGNGTVFS